MSNYKILITSAVNGALGGFLLAVFLLSITTIYTALSLENGTWTVTGLTHHFERTIEIPIPLFYASTIAGAMIGLLLGIKKYAKNDTAGL